MPPRKKCSVAAPEIIREEASVSRKRKQFKKDDSSTNDETKRKRPKKGIPELPVENKCKIPSPNKSKAKPKRSLKKNQNNQIKSEADVMEVQNLAVDEMNVEQLLALGEKLQGVGFSSTNEGVEDYSDSDLSDFEEVKNVESDEVIIPKEGVNITLEVPSLYNKRKSKGLDLEAHLKRQMNRVRKELQLLMHKVHVLCWIAHLRFVNLMLNNPTLMRNCAVLVKSKNLYPPKYSDLSYLEGVLKWYHKNIEFMKESDPLCTGGLFEELQYQIEKKQAFNCKAFIFIFIILLRVLGLKARIVMSFQVLPVKPSLLELYGDVIKARSEKLKNLKEVATNKEKSDNKNSCAGTAENISEQSKEKSVKDKQNNQSKRKQSKNNAISNIKADNSDSEFESENYRSSVKSTKKNLNDKICEKEQNNLESDSKAKIRKSIVNVKRQSRIDLKNEDNEDNEDNDFKPVSVKKKNYKKREDKKSDAGEEYQRKKEGLDIWVEVFLESEEKWISVDVSKQKIHCVNEIYSRTTHPVTYIVACNNDHTLKDVTKRYVPHWHSDTRKRRVDEDWWNETMKPYLPSSTAQDREEDEDINRQLSDMPLPSSISEFKDHPLYALKRHLLKFEAIYPPDAPTLGFVRGEPIYARECIHTLHSREMWYKQARVVRLKEEPYKIVKARPKYDKMTGEIKKDLPLELFGKWQTEDYIPPVATDGKVPRNEYGNVDLFKPCMLPIGTVHLQIPALNRVAKKLDIDCAPATVGFEFHSGGSHPVFDGFVVCEEFKDVLLDAWNKEIDESSKREAEKREKRVYGNWKKLIRGLLIREKLKIKYAFGENSDEEGGNSKLLSNKTSTSELRKK